MENKKTIILQVLLLIAVLASVALNLYQNYALNQIMDIVGNLAENTESF